MLINKKNIKLYYEELDEVKELMSLRYKISEEKVEDILFNYVDSEESGVYPENYKELLDAEIKDIAEETEVDEKIVRAIINDCDLTDTLVDARMYAIKKGWVK